jgi:hypothetical protein
VIAAPSLDHTGATVFTRLGYQPVNFTAPMIAKTIMMMPARCGEPLVKKGILSRDDIPTELSDNLPTDDKLLEEDIKRLAAEIGLRWAFSEEGADRKARSFSCAGKARSFSCAGEELCRTD